MVGFSSIQDYFTFNKDFLLRLIWYVCTLPKKAIMNSLREEIYISINSMAISMDLYRYASQSLLLGTTPSLIVTLWSVEKV